MRKFRTLLLGRGRPARLAAVASTTVALAAGGLAMAEPASAHPSCDRGNHCQFWLELPETNPNTSRHQSFNGDPDFSDNRFANGRFVDNNSWAASNSTTQNLESHYYDGYHPAVGGAGFLFCINPGMGANLPTNLRDRASSLILRPRTPVRCLA
jgi:hypothetical protein